MHILSLVKIVLKIWISVDTNNVRKLNKVNVFQQKQNYKKNPQLISVIEKIGKICPIFCGLLRKYEF